MPIVIAPSAATVTAMVAEFAPSLTVIVADPAATEVISILPAFITAVATVPSEEEGVPVPMRPKVASSFAVVLLVAAAKTTTVTTIL